MGLGEKDTAEGEEVGAWHAKAVSAALLSLARHAVALADAMPAHKGLWHVSAIEQHSGREGLPLGLGLTSAILTKVAF